jgi:hypothetical protein
MCEHVYALEAAPKMAFQSRSPGPHLQRVLQQRLGRRTSETAIRA